MARVGEKESRAHELGPTVSGGGVLGQAGACSSVVGEGNLAWYVPHHYLGVFVPHTCMYQAVQGSGGTQASLALH